MSVAVLLLLGVVVAPPARAADCAEPTNVAVSADRAVRALFSDGNPAVALQEVAQAHQHLECQATLALPEDLAILYQAGGAAALELGDAAEAQRWFRQAALMAPGVPFDQATFGPKAANVAEQARPILGEPVQIVGHARGNVWVDGRPYGAGARFALTPSEHLVQFVDTQGAVNSSVLLAEDAAFQRLTPVSALSARSLRQRAGGAALATLGLASLVGWGFYYAEESAEAVRRGDYNEFSQGAIVMWGLGGAGMTAAGTLVLVF